MYGRFERDPRGAVELGDDNALGAIDDEGALRRHERDFAHVHFFFLGAIFLPEGERDMKRSAEGLAFAHRLPHGKLGLTDFVADEIEGDFFVVGRDREHLTEHGLEAQILPAAGRDVGLKKLHIGVELHFNQVRRFDNLADFAKVLSFGHVGGCSVCRFFGCQPHSALQRSEKAGKRTGPGLKRVRTVRRPCGLPLKKSVPLADRKQEKTTKPQGSQPANLAGRLWSSVERTVSDCGRRWSKKGTQGAGVLREKWAKRLPHKRAPGKEKFPCRDAR